MKVVIDVPGSLTAEVAEDAVVDGLIAQARRQDAPITEEAIAEMADNVRAVDGSGCGGPQ